MRCWTYCVVYLTSLVMRKDWLMMRRTIPWQSMFSYRHCCTSAPSPSATLLQPLPSELMIVAVLLVKSEESKSRIVTLQDLPETTSYLRWASNILICKTNWWQYVWVDFSHSYTGCFIRKHSQAYLLCECPSCWLSWHSKSWFGVSGIGSMAIFHKTFNDQRHSLMALSSAYFLYWTHYLWQRPCAVTVVWP